MGKCNQFDLVGKIKGRLIVLSFHHVKDEKSFWLCQCQCGNQKVIARNSIVDNKSGTKSCGCLSMEKKIAGKHGYAKHGHKKSAEYRCWISIKDRCYNKRNKRAYRDYGGRGIIVCDRWLHSYENFLADMGRAPSPKHSIDRKDNDGNYEPSNCRWATPKIQGNNQQKTVRVNYKGVIHTLFELSLMYGVPQKTIYKRIYMANWPVEEAVESPKGTCLKERPTCFRKGHTSNLGKKYNKVVTAAAVVTIVTLKE